MSKFDLKRFNSFLDKATEAISCDSECQKKKTEEELKNKYLNAQNNLTLAEPEFQTARRNYYSYVSGQSGYDEMLEKEFNEKADLIVKEFKENFQVEIGKIKSQLETYNGLLVNFKNVVDLDKKYKRENEVLYNKFKENSNDVLTNERKTYYEDQQNETLNSYYYYVLIVIYIIVLLCLIIFSLIYPTEITFKVKILLVILFVVLPFVSTWILGKIIYIMYLLFDLIPKNVYK